MRLSSTPSQFFKNLIVMGTVGITACSASTQKESITEIHVPAEKNVPGNTEAPPEIRKHKPTEIGEISKTAADKLVHCITNDYRRKKMVDRTEAKCGDKIKQANICYYDGVFELAGKPDAPAGCNEMVIKANKPNQTLEQKLEVSADAFNCYRKIQAAKPAEVKTLDACFKDEIVCLTELQQTWSINCTHPPRPIDPTRF